MPTVVMERLDEVAAAWRRGLDADELANPAGPLFADEIYVDYDITATGSIRTIGQINTTVPPTVGPCACL